MNNKDMGAMSEQNNPKRALVPRLRFPEFQDAGNWKTEALRKLAKRCAKKNSEGEHKRVLTNSAEYGVIDQRDYFDKDIANQGNLEGYYIVEKGDYVYNPRISASAPVGPISKNNVGTGVMSPLYTVFRFISSENDFFAHYFKSPHWHHYMRQASSTGARHDRMSITNDDFMNMPLPVSVPKEQQKIADSLSSLDELIMAENRKLGTLKVYKNGLMQQLFPREGETVPRLRLPGFRRDPQWISATLGDIANVQSGGTPARTNPAYWNGDIPWVTTSLIDSSTILKADEYITKAGLEESSAKIFPKGTLLMAMYGQGRTRGRVSVLGIDAATNQACAAIILKRRGISTDFVFQNLASRYEEIRKISNSGGQENLSAGLIEGISFSFPDNESEQEYIANTLSSIDGLITTQRQKIDALEIHKKGLMQQLFPVMAEALA
ncbi:restriction endonuclease subunit S [Ralstonia thomasii]|jgi:type I restriction enzyme S subunit|uniref:Type I restriction modification DNA specificity domain-containing protein n=2 Tax=Ralstonia TaxID=48736 RepID=A0AAD2F028_9RALS|nr:MULTISPECIES: restriction endonuclease subunit S [Ralstonia]POH87865.1 restriction endonuclease subunit S [Ralstonia pickettii]CAJ0787167.1 hypothetical protein R77560_01535 [Ralstonia sp. LMG 18095]CAJ0874867.1 hypothetical protein R6138_02060 [Ralstonia sp. LMG 18095]